ncbi:MAG TPA: hypothetical protein VIY86_14580, partial [Pirellulaceae bacterium]
ASFSGAGTFLKGNANVISDTTWNVAVVDLDDGPTALHANLTVNASAVDSSGDGVDAPGAITIDPNKRLTVNISGGSSWALDPLANITYNGMITLMANVYLAGSDLTMNGTVDQFGVGRTEARLAIGPTGVINIQSLVGRFELGSGSIANPNTIAGGTINGPGTLADNGIRALHGFGTINAPVRLLNSQLKADNGILTIVGDITDTAAIGTSDSDGILNIPAPWSTSIGPGGGSVFSVQMAGGEIRGGTITNRSAEGIQGHGQITSRVVNNSRITGSGSAGQSLVLQTVGNDNDWDGTNNLGTLRALNADLVLRDNARFLFEGTVEAGTFVEVAAEGFELDFQADSKLVLTRGRYRSTESTHFRGSLTTPAADYVSKIIVPAGKSMDFLPTSTAVLTGNLELHSANTIIHSGATFTGGGALIVPVAAGLFP